MPKMVVELAAAAGVERPLHAVPSWKLPVAPASSNTSPTAVSRNT